jgi:hypothetical protein
MLEMCLKCEKVGISLFLVGIVEKIVGITALKVGIAAKIVGITAL